jgi:hypothetical protein
VQEKEKKEAPARKKPYRTPRLTVFGPLSRMTQNGTGAIKESNGKSICGGNFQHAGGSSC